MILVIIDGIATSTSNGKAVFNIHIPLEPVSNEARHGYWNGNKQFKLT